MSVAATGIDIKNLADIAKYGAIAVAAYIAYGVAKTLADKGRTLADLSLSDLGDGLAVTTGGIIGSVGDSFRKVGHWSDVLSPGQVQQLLSYQGYFTEAEWVDVIQPQLKQQLERGTPYAQLGIHDVVEQRQREQG